MESTLPGPVKVVLYGVPKLTVVVAGEVHDVSVHAANLCAIGALLGPPESSAVVTPSGVTGTPASSASPGTVVLTGVTSGVLDDGIEVQELSCDDIVALTGSGVMRTLHDATAQDGNQNQFPS